MTIYAIKALMLVASYLPQLATLGAASLLAGIALINLSKGV